MLEKFESKEKSKNYIEKNLESIKIIGNETIDVINGQGCLIKPETTILFGSNDKGDKVKIKDFEKPFNVTSHGYMYCAEVTGELSNGEKFYIHAMEPFTLKSLLESMIKEIQNEFPEEKIKINNITVKSDFDRYGEEKSVVDGKKRDYERYINYLDIDIDNIDIKNESFIGFTSEKNNWLSHRRK
jgi:hypothetical protein